MKTLTSVIRTSMVVCIFLIASAAVGANAQCVSNPTGETAVGLKNASNYFITFYIDGDHKGGVPIRDRSIEFIVTPGEHVLLAEAWVSGELVSASRLVVVPAGAVCTWTVTDPAKLRSTAKATLSDALFQQAVVSIVIPN